MIITPRFAAKLFIALDMLVLAFQLALVAGAPWGALTWGGRFPGRLPPQMRVGAAVSAVIVLVMGAIVASRGRLLFPRWHSASRKLIWIVVAYTAVGVVLNAITPSPWERALWLPVTLVLGLCAVVVSRSE